MPDFAGFPRKRVGQIRRRRRHDAIHRRARQTDARRSSRRRRLPNILGEVVAEAGRTQLRMAETEKYPHVTYFLNGGREEPYPGEDRIMVPSPKVATYDLQPEMSAPELTDKAVAAISVRQIRSDRAQLRQSRHGRPHRQPAGRDQGGGDGRHRARPHRRRRSKAPAARCWSPPTTAIAR